MLRVHSPFTQCVESGLYESTSRSDLTCSLYSICVYSVLSQKLSLWFILKELFKNPVNRPQNVSSCDVLRLLLSMFISLTEDTFVQWSIHHVHFEMAKPGKSAIRPAYLCFESFLINRQRNICHHSECLRRSKTKSASLLCSVGTCPNLIQQILKTDVVCILCACFWSFENCTFVLLYFDIILRL